MFLQILASVFFVIAIFVHIHGLIYHPTTESDVSHVVHLVSYTICLASLWLRTNNLFWLAPASVYPIYYHTKCAFGNDFTPNFICLLTVALMTTVIGVYAHRHFKSA